MRALAIISIVMALLAGFVSFGFTEEVSRKKAYTMDYLYDYENAYQSGSESYQDSYNYAMEGYDEVAEATVTAGLILMIYLLFMVACCIVSLAKLKTMTMKVMAIIGLCLTGIMVSWDILMMSNPDGISFDEVGAAFMLFCLFGLAYSIVFTVQAFRKRPQPTA